MTLHEYVDMIRHKRIAVIGIGVSNMPLIELLLNAGCDVTACDTRNLEQMGEDGFFKQIGLAESPKKEPKTPQDRKRKTNTV